MAAAACGTRCMGQPSALRAAACSHAQWGQRRGPACDSPVRSTSPLSGQLHQAARRPLPPVPDFLASPWRIAAH